MSHFHAVVWMDHAEAHVLQFTEDAAERTLVHAHGKHRQIHHRKGAVGSGKAPEDIAYFHAVIESLKGAQEILVVGPASAKQEFKKHLDTHHKDVAAKVVAVENADHPTDGELLNHARKFFLAADRMRLQK
ncbi:MAG: translational machinery protein [Betaproteobacteria bacterium]|nr:translational machinery protein [Betaproteobacteria bacterium]